MVDQSAGDRCPTSSAELQNAIPLGGHHEEGRLRCAPRHSSSHLTAELQPSVTLALASCQAETRRPAVSGREQVDGLVVWLPCLFAKRRQHKRRESGVVDVIRPRTSPTDLVAGPCSILASPSAAPAANRAISVPRPGAEYTRGNRGMEAIATTGGWSTLAGPTGPAASRLQYVRLELFSSLTICANPASSDVEEGSLGATVDLQTAHSTTATHHIK
jgi:hypothetical protein